MRRAVFDFRSVGRRTRELTPTAPAFVMALACAGAWVVAAPQARAEAVLVVADLQSLVSVTQPGWSDMGLDTDVVGSGTQPLQVTAVGAVAGISAILDGGASWNGRGADRDRAVVLGTTFNDVVSDLWFNRQLTATLNLTGLATGTQYTVRAWHNDSYTINAGAAAGGGTVSPSLVGGTVVSSSNGTVTNLRGTQTNAAFGITTLIFTATSSSAAITLTRNGGDFTGIPVSGIQLTTAFVPEPMTTGLLAAAATCWLVWRRGRRTHEPSVSRAGR